MWGKIRLMKHDLTITDLQKTVQEMVQKGSDHEDFGKLYNKARRIFRNQFPGIDFCGWLDCYISKLSN